MTDNGNRNLRLDLFALGLLALVVFLALALLTYSPADPRGRTGGSPLNNLYQPDVLVYPQNAPVENACGKWGALVASMLLTGLGLGAYYFVVSLGTLDALLLLRREIDAPVVRAFGWCASLLGLTTIAALAVPNWSPGPVIGSGGYLGALGAGLLEMHFATIGALILSTGLVLGGLLALDRLRPDARGLHGARHDGGGLGQRASLAARPTRGQRRDADPRHGRRAEPAVRVGGVAVDRRRGRRGRADEEEEWDDEAEESGGGSVGAKRRPPRRPVVRGPSKDAPAHAEHEAAGPRVRNRGSKSERQKVMQSLDEASLAGDTHDYQLPSLDLLVEPDDICFESQSKEVRRKAKILERRSPTSGSTSRSSRSKRAR